VDGAQAASRHLRRAVVRGARNLVNHGILRWAEAGDHVPNASHREGWQGALQSTRPERAPFTVGTALGTVLTLGLALFFAYGHPDQNRWPALALVLALGLDAAARIVARAVRQQTGVETEFRGLPSPMLVLGNATWIGAAVVAVPAGLRPELFPLLASALAGLVAMGACARLALARMVVAIEAAERAAAEAKKAEATKKAETNKRGEGTGR
jgi:hypothetical protein